MISRPEVNAVIVSTPEHEHTRAVLQALELGKPVLVEKPIALDLGDARKIVAAVKETKGDLFVGYTKRYTRSYILAKEYIAKGCLGQVLGATTRVYNSRAQAFQILKRSPHASPVLDVLDLLRGSRLLVSRRATPRPRWWRAARRGCFRPRDTARMT